jgi:hypothetical protein
MMFKYFSEGCYTILVCYFFFFFDNTTDRLLYITAANNLYTGPIVLFGTYFHEYVVYMMRFFLFVYLLHITDNDTVVLHCGIQYFFIIQVQTVVFVTSKVMQARNDEDFYIEI